MHTTNYANTFLAVAPDCPAERGEVPPEGARPSVALLTFRMIHAHPYRHTSDDVIFTVYADRTGIPPAERAKAREAFFSRGQPCLRSSDLGKRYGWGIHSDARGRVALYGVESEAYQALARGVAPGVRGEPVVVRQALRTRR